MFREYIIGLIKIKTVEGFAPGSCPCGIAPRFIAALGQKARPKP
jgi:hypothetical protein